MNHEVWQPFRDSELIYLLKFIFVCLLYVHKLVFFSSSYAGIELVILYSFERRKLQFFILHIFKQRWIYVEEGGGVQTPLDG